MRLIQRQRQFVPSGEGKANMSAVLTAGTGCPWDMELLQKSGQCPASACGGWLLINDLSNQPPDMADGSAPNPLHVDRIQA